MRGLGDADADSWTDPYAFKNMKEALKFAMSLNERLVSKLEGCARNLDEKDQMINTQAIIIDELTQELDETKTAANL